MKELVSPVTPRPRVAVNVEADDRTVLFPSGNFLSHILVSGDASRVDGEDVQIRLDAVFSFNEQRTDSLIAALEFDDALALARALLDAVFQGRTQHILTQTATIAVVFNPNGFVLRFGEERAAIELFIASPAIVRLAQGILRMTDRLQAPAPH